MVVLLPVSGSGVDEVTDAVFERSASVDGVTLIVTVAEPPEAIVPSGHVTGVVPGQGPPGLAVAETRLTVAGRLSVTDAPAAEIGTRVCDHDGVRQGSCPT